MTSGSLDHRASIANHGSLARQHERAFDITLPAEAFLLASGMRREDR
jgi:hypothetical protein